MQITNHYICLNVLLLDTSFSFKFMTCTSAFAIGSFGREGKPRQVEASRGKPRQADGKTDASRGMPRQAEGGTMAKLEVQCLILILCGLNACVVVWILSKKHDSHYCHGNIHVWLVCKTNMCLGDCKSTSDLFSMVVGCTQNILICNAHDYIL